MSRITGLSRASSPFLDRGGLGALLGWDGQVRVHADPASLRLIRDRLLDVAGREYGRAFAHVRERALRDEVDHYVAVYVCGHEFNESGLPDGDGDSWTWRTGIGTYSDGSSAVRPWSSEIGAAIFLAAQACPWLRIDLRLGGKRQGVRAARFSRRHPIAALAGAAVALPTEPPRLFARSPASGVLHAALEAMAMEKEAGYPYAAATRRDAA